MSSAGRHRRGFSVIELMAALALLGILASAAWPLAETARQRERERELKRALWSIRDALDAYKQASERLPVGTPGRTTSGYPATLQDLVVGLPDDSLPGGKRRFLRAIPRDPFAAPDVPADHTWLQRSYASEPDAPRAGDDVYDVRSRAKGRALNGEALSQW